ncbi:MAG: alpha/beta hydrolase [Spongiibacteraceae bacterium]
MEKNTSIHVAGVNFFARQKGENPNAVFIHGFGDSLNTWDGLWSELGESFSGLRYDLRGFGRSVSHDDQRFSHTDDLLAIVDASNIERCDLIGVSMGGGIALNFALNHPDRVSKLVLISPAITAWEWSAGWKMLWQLIVTSARAGDMDKARELWWQHPVFASARDSSVAEVLRESIRHYSGAQWVRDYQQHGLPDIERLDQLKPPTLLLTGGRDVEDFRLIADVIEAGANPVSRVDFAGLGHLLHMEDAVACADEITRFISK